MDKTEANLLPINEEKLNYSDDIYEKPVYESTLQLPVRPPTRKLTRMFKSKTYNQIMSTICFVLFIIGFFWSVFKNGEVDVQKIQKYADLLFFETGAKPRCERMSSEEINRFLVYLQNSTTCPSMVGDSFWPYCERAIPFTADIYTCCENNQFQSLKLGSIDMNYNNVLFLMDALKRAF